MRKSKLERVTQHLIDAGFKPDTYGFNIRHGPKEKSDILECWNTGAWKDGGHVQIYSAHTMTELQYGLSVVPNSRETCLYGNFVAIPKPSKIPVCKRKVIANGSLRCSRCKIERPLTEFGLSRHRPLGYAPYCKDCCSERRRLRLDAGGNQGQSTKKRDPYKLAAGNKLRKAVMAGKITKPDSCQGCGATGVKIEAHHPDYSLPYSVEWLCKWCHARKHRKPWSEKPLTVFS